MVLPLKTPHELTPLSDSHVVYEKEGDNGSISSTHIVQHTTYHLTSRAAVLIPHWRQLLNSTTTPEIPNNQFQLGKVNEFTF